MALNADDVPMNPRNIFINPGAIYPYALVEEGVEDPFEPISSFAIRESGMYGPLDEEKLKKFLKHKFDRRCEPSRNIIQHYTQDVAGLNIQLRNLLNRIKQIKDCEKERNDYILTRIRKFETILKEGRPMPETLFPLSLTIPAKDAVHTSGSEGPLPENELIEFLNTGRFNNIGQRNDLRNQLMFLRIHIIDNLDIQKHRLKLPYDRIVKVLSDIIHEMMI